MNQVQFICLCGIFWAQRMRIAGYVQCMSQCLCGIQNKSDSTNENGWLGPMYMSMWNTEHFRLVEWEQLVMSNVCVHVEYRTNPTQRIRKAGQVQCTWLCGILNILTHRMGIAGYVQCMCLFGIKTKFNSVNQNSWLGPMYMFMWNTEQVRLR